MTQNMDGHTLANEIKRASTLTAWICGLFHEQHREAVICIIDGSARSAAVAVNLFRTGNEFVMHLCSRS